MADSSSFDMDAEKHVLGSVLQEPDAFWKVVSILGERTSVFYTGAHQVLWGAMQSLVREGHPIDLYSVTNALKASDELSRMGSVTYLYEVQESVPTSANVEYYAEVVREKSVRRELIRAGNEIVNRAGREDVPLSEVLDGAQRVVNGVRLEGSVREVESLERVVESNLSDLERLQEGAAVGTGISTGYGCLDAFGGGLQPEELVILAGRPSEGKTALACNLAANVCRGGGAALFFSLEMSRKLIAGRFLANLAQVDGLKFRHGRLSKEEWARLTKAQAEMEHWECRICDVPAATMGLIRSETRRAHSETGKLRLVVVDYLQLMGALTDTSAKGRSHFSREQEVAGFSRELKSLARDVGVTVVGLSQLNRASESRPNKEPQLSDLRESGALEQDADLVWFVWRPPVKQEGPAEETPYAQERLLDIPEWVKVHVKCAKNRNGPQGTVSMDFYPRYQRFLPEGENF